jgi:hypothetical protein
MSYVYQQSLSSRHNRNLSRNRDVQTYRNVSAGLGPVSTTLFITVVIGITALLYLTQITKTTVYGYQVSELSQEHQALLDKNQQLEIEAARLQSIARIESSAVARSLEPEDQIVFSTE